MQFTWDENKRKTNLQKHGVSFADAALVFEGAVFTFEDDRFDYGEHRFITYGLLRSMVVVIAHTEEDDVIRIISMRKAKKHEEQFYHERFAE